MKNIEEKKESLFARHFKKKRATCSACKNNIDAYIDRCPYCGEERNTNFIPKKFLNMSFFSDYKELMFLVIGILGLTIVGFFIYTGLINFPIKDNKELVNALVNLLSYIICCALIFCVLSHDTKFTLNKTKSQTLKLYTWIFVAIGLALIIAFSYGYTYTLKACGIEIKDSANQSSVTKMVKSLPALSFFIVVIFAPIVEEFAYRVGLFSFLRKRNRYLAYIVTVLVFALMHFLPALIEDPKLMANEALNIPLYIIPSLILAISYEYTGISGSLYIHILNNLLSFIIVLAL